MLHRNTLIILSTALLIIPALAIDAISAQGDTERMSAYATFAEGNSSSWYSSLSADGQFVAFWSQADNLVIGDTNGKIDVFVHDRATVATIRVSVSSTGSEGNGGSGEPSISADGRYVAFQSPADNLVAGDTNDRTDVFVHDRNTGVTSRVSLSSAGIEGDAVSFRPSISADGRFVAFLSVADNLVIGDTNGCIDMFVHDRDTGQTTRVSVDSFGNEGNDDCISDDIYYPHDISADGRHVVFPSRASNMVIGDTNGVADIFVHDRMTGQTTRVSVDSFGIEANGSCGACSCSADGRHVAFSSHADNLVAGDTNDDRDVFVHDRDTGLTERVSVDSGGVEGNWDSDYPSISDDGQFVSFRSASSNLVVGDTNDDWDIFVHDRTSGETVRVNTGYGGTEADQISYEPTISGDGNIISYSSFATNLVPGDLNGFTDIFVHDRTTSVTERVSRSTGTAVEGNGDSISPAISLDGCCVAFASDADNLVTGDTNSGTDVFVRDRGMGQIERVSVATGGAQATGNSLHASISADGNIVAFESDAGDLVTGDLNGAADIFVHDRDSGATNRVSISTAGSGGNNSSHLPSISADGRYVAFHSAATNLVAGDSNGADDVFVHDRNTGVTGRVSLSSAGIEGDSWSWSPSISPDGRFVAFESSSSNLVPGDTNGAWDIFVHDRQTGNTVRVSVNSAGLEGNNVSLNADISAAGRYVTFDSVANNLVPDDTNLVDDIFVHHLASGTTTRVSVDSAGTQADWGSNNPSISADGRYVVFATPATNLVSGDTNLQWDVFVHDLVTGETGRASVSSTGDEGDNISWYPAISANGCHVAFESYASSLVPDDTNASGDVFVHEYLDCSGSLGDTVWVDLGCTPSVGTLPFNSIMDAAFINLTAEYRRAAGRIDVTTGSGFFFANYRIGFTNISPLAAFSVRWTQRLPAMGSVVGENVFSFVGEDVTPAPFNQPPYSPAGDTDVSVCTVIGSAP